MYVDETQKTANSEMRFVEGQGGAKRRKGYNIAKSTGGGGGRNASTHRRFRRVTLVETRRLPVLLPRGLHVERLVRRRHLPRYVFLSSVPRAVVGRDDLTVHRGRKIIYGEEDARETS